MCTGPRRTTSSSQIGKKLNIPVYGDPKEKSAVKIAKHALKEFDGFDVIIFDTSGRHSLEGDLIRGDRGHRQGRRTRSRRYSSSTLRQDSRPGPRPRRSTRRWG